MLLQTLPIFGLWAVASAAVYNPAVAHIGTNVNKITAESFETFVGTNDVVLVEFFAPWCGHCKKLGPDLIRAADELVDRDIEIAQIDCSVEDEFCSDWGVKAYPTMKVFKGINSSKPYTGERDPESIVSYLLRAERPDVQLLKGAEELEALLETSDEPVVANLYRDSDAVSNETFYGVAAQLRDKFTFVQVSEDALNEKYNVTKSTVLVFRPDDLEPGEYGLDQVPHTDVGSTDELVQFVQLESRPLFGEMNGDTAEEYQSAGLPLAFFFYLDYEGQRQVMAPLMKELARKHRGEMNFVGLNANRYGIHARNLHMQQLYPLFAVDDIASGKKYGMDQSSGLKPREIEGWLEKFFKGELEPNVPLDYGDDVEPETKNHQLEDNDEDDSNSAVVTLDAQLHDQLVADKTKKVLVEYFAPWCTHCKELAPKYRALAEKVKDDDQYVIAKLDYTLNEEVDVEITGFPTIMFYDRGAEPVQFSKMRTLPNLLEFIGYSETAAAGHVKGHDEL